MGIGKLLGRVAGAPFRVLNIPVRVVEKTVDVVVGCEDGSTRDTFGASKPLEGIASILKDAGEEVDR